MGECPEPKKERVVKKRPIDPIIYEATYDPCIYPDFAKKQKMERKRAEKLLGKKHLSRTRRKKLERTEEEREEEKEEGEEKEEEKEEKEEGETDEVAEETEEEQKVKLRNLDNAKIMYNKMYSKMYIKNREIKNNKKKTVKKGTFLNSVQSSTCFSFVVVSQN